MSSIDAVSHLVLLGSGPALAHAKFLRNRSGLRLSVSSDFTGTGRFAPGPKSDGILFESLNAALVHGDPDQLRALAACTRGYPIKIEREQMLRASGSPETPETHETGSPSFTDNAFATWGLQATRSQSRYTGRGIRVAILDTGLDRTHPDFMEGTIVSRCFVPAASVDDANGHGTHCAGILRGPRNTFRRPRYGVAPDAELYVAKVLDEQANGSDGDILAGIDWAIRNDCAVISMSLGTAVLAGTPHSEVYEQIARRALACGSLLIAAAGNESARPDRVAPVEHPANCPSIVSVGAVGPDLALAPFSNANPDPDDGGVDLVAPGIAVLSSIPRPDLYETQNGTSPAAPYVAGIAALLAQAHPSARGAALRNLLLEQARALPIAARDAGAGLAQAPQ